MKIYCIRNVVTGKAYIGLTSMTLRKRWTSHVWRARSEAVDTALYSSIRKYGPESFVVQEFASLCPGLGWNDLCELESLLIVQEGTRLPAGYNMTDGGDGTAGYRPTEAQLSKQRGRHHSEITRAKMSASHRARGTQTHTEEALKKIGAAAKGRNVGRAHSPEELGRMRDSWTPEVRAAHSARITEFYAKKRTKVSYG